MNKHFSTILFYHVLVFLLSCSSYQRSSEYTTIFQGTTVVDNLLNSDDVHYMLGALKTLGLHVEEDSASKRAIVEGCGGIFPVGKESTEEIQLFLGNAGTAMRPLTAAVTAAGGNSRSVKYAF